jgi:hypothetical protein
MPSISASPEIARLVGIVFQDQVDVTLWPNRGADALGQLDQDMRAGVVYDGMHCIEAQAIEVILFQPVERVMDEKLAHLPAAGAIEIDRRAPWRVVVFRKEFPGVKVEIVPFRSEMIVDHIEQNHQAARVCRFNQRLEVLRAAVAAVGGIGQHAVITPVSGAGEIRHGHEFDGGNP